MARVAELLAAPVPGGRVEVRALLGEGGQGTVHECFVPATGQRMALKWYHPHMAAPSQRRALDLLVESGPPSASFLWPTAVVEVPGVPGFGYLMPLRPERFRGVADLLAGRAQVAHSGAVSLCLQLAHSFLLLHSQGLCYRDISFGNVFFDPADGSVLVCDCDNVGVDGAGESMVLGTRRFMAPEIVRGDARPSTATDLHSLAVLLFYVLVSGHPLLGRRELDYPPQDVARAELELFGRAPLFVFDPADRGNAPVESLHGPVEENWRRYPQPLRDLFTTAFTRGLHDPDSGRVRESVWRRGLVALHDSIAQCGACGAEHFFDAADPHQVCWSCGRATDPPLRLVFDEPAVRGGGVLVLTEATRLCVHHLRHDYDLSTVVAEVTRHPQRPDRWGLRNGSTSSWQVHLPTGPSLEVPPGRVLGLVPGARIDFGGRTAVLHA